MPNPKPNPNPNPNPNPMTAKVRRLLDDAQLRATIGQAGREETLRWDWRAATSVLLRNLPSPNPMPDPDPNPNPTPTLTPNPTPHPNQVLRNLQYSKAERNHKERLATPPLQRFFRRLRRSADEAADAVFGSGGLQLSTNSSMP